MATKLDILKKRKEVLRTLSNEKDRTKREELRNDARRLLKQMLKAEGELTVYDAYELLGY